MGQSRPSVVVSDPASLIPSSGTLREYVERIAHLDLEPIKFKIIHQDDGECITIEEVDVMALEYKRFLILNAKLHYAGKVMSLVPTKGVDKFWHFHILDTQKYAEDCAYCLGYFLHHFPYLGLRGEADKQRLRDEYRESIKIYKEVFGEPLIPFASDGEGCDAPQCSPASCNGDDSPANQMRRPVLSR